MGHLRSEARRVNRDSMTSKYYWQQEPTDSREAQPMKSQRNTVEDAAVSRAASSQSPAHNGSVSGILRRDFFLFMALFITAIVIYGFSHTFNAKVLHPRFALPVILYVHIMTFAAWILLFITQASLVYSHKVQWHRRVGVFGLALGAAMPVVGIMTALTMTRLEVQHGQTGGVRFLIIIIYSISAFAAAFGLAAILRKRPEYHRRLMLLATCILTVAAFGRFPGVSRIGSDLCVDGLIVLAIVRDWLGLKIVHPVYRYALPSLMSLQGAANFIYLRESTWWIGVAHWILQV
jgi:uncharacterized membrane protein YozB (DUF420 family)